MTHRRILAIALLLAVAGCQTVEPWDRGTLARREMLPDPDRLDTALRNQIYDSKEAASGGAHAAGAGCGCK